VAVALVWAFVHPRFGGHWLRGVRVEPAGEVGRPEHPLLRTLLSTLNLDFAPAPVQGWVWALLGALPVILALAALVAWLSRGKVRDAGTGASTQSLLEFGGAWALIAWLPLGQPGLGWHAYYALAGALGAWLALATVLARAPGVAIGVVSALALLRVGMADTPSMDWGTEWYQRRAGGFLAFMRADLLHKEPHPPAHARLFFVGVPSNVGFITEGAPALRVWYRDTTLSGGLFRDYRKRTSDGVDRFFRYDSTSGWTVLEPGDENVAAAMNANPHYRADMKTLAATFARADDWARAAPQHVKLAQTGGSDSLDQWLNASVAYAMAGDTAQAIVWARRAAESPAAPESLRAEVRRILSEVRPAPKR
jgi:hypothetical protein